MARDIPRLLNPAAFNLAMAIRRHLTKRLSRPLPKNSMG
jgi:hypothetical protein